MMENNASELPAGWARATLPELIDQKGALTDGDWVETEDQDPHGDVRLTQLADVGDGVFRDRSRRFMSSKRAAEMNCTFLKPGDIMIARMPDPLGRACVFPGWRMPCVTAVDVCIVRPSKAISSRWLASFVNAPAFRVAVSGLQAGSTRKRISKANLCTIPLPVPPPAEQVRITEAVDSSITRLDDAQRSLERAQRNLQRYRASVLKAAVEGRLVPTEAELARAEGRDYEPASRLLERILAERRRRWEEAALVEMTAAGKRPKNDAWKHDYPEPNPPELKDLPGLPEGWCWTTVEQLASDEPRSIQSGPFGSHLHHAEFQATGRLVIGIDNVREGQFSMGANHRISEAKFQKLKRFEARPGDVLITVMATVGRCCVVPDDLEPAIITKHVYRITPDRCLIHPGYLLITLWGGPEVRRQIFGLAQGQTRLGLNGSIIRRLMIPLPPLPEQRRITEEVERLLSVGDAANKTLADTETHCQRLRQSILKWAFEGKLADQDPTDEPASVLLDRIRAKRAAAETPKKPTSRGRPKKTAAAKTT